MDTKIEIIDTHCHLYSGNLKMNLSEKLANCKEAGVSKIFMPNVDNESIDDMLYVEANGEDCYPMMGLHPCSVKENYKDELKIVKDWFDKRNFFGVGETGIDLYWDKTFIEEQKASFDYQIGLSEELNLPIIIHSRDSLYLTIEMIEKRQKGGLSGIFHCFTGTMEEANRIIDLGFYLGIGGVITYKNSDLPQVIDKISLENIVLETDSPYLPPVPKRGKENEPAFLKFVCEKVAEIKKDSVENVAQITTLNANKIFKLNQ